MNGLRADQKAVFWVGAGLSWASDVPQPPSHDRISFLRDPEAVMADYAAWREQLKACSPNRGHRSLARLQERFPQTKVVTLNQDGLLERVGCQALQLHGSVWVSRCFRCDQPYCRCGGKPRPDVVWPGEEIPPARVEQVKAWLESCDILFCVGSSGRSLPAAEMPLLWAGKAYRIEINPEKTAHSSHFHELWSGPAEELLEKLIPSDVHPSR